MPTPAPFPPAHLPSADRIEAWPDFTADTPFRLLVSGCLAGQPVGFDGSSYGVYPHILRLIGLRNVQAVTFCPEALAFGAPRPLCDIEGGDGHDVLAGRARMVSARGEDWTEGAVAAAHAMLRLAQARNVHLAVLMDISASCGSQVIYAGQRPGAPYQAGHGVCAALLIEHAIPVVNQRDYRTLDRILAKLDPQHAPWPHPRDHHESEWYRGYFPAAT